MYGWLRLLSIVIIESGWNATVFVKNYLSRSSKATYKLDEARMMIQLIRRILKDRKRLADNDRHCETAIIIRLLVNSEFRYYPSNAKIGTVGH